MIVRQWVKSVLPQNKKGIKGKSNINVGTATETDSASDESSKGPNLEGMKPEKKQPKKKKKKSFLQRKLSKKGQVSNDSFAFGKSKSNKNTVVQQQRVPTKPTCAMQQLSWQNMVNEELFFRRWENLVNKELAEFEATKPQGKRINKTPGGGSNHSKMRNNNGEGAADDYKLQRMRSKRKKATPNMYNKSLAFSTDDEDDDIVAEKQAAPASVKQDLFFCFCV